MSLKLPPIPNEPIGESPLWRNWFQRLGTMISTPSTGVNHNDLGNIQGGTSSERYHLTAAQVAKVDALTSTTGSGSTGGTSTTTTTMSPDVLAFSAAHG